MMTADVLTATRRISTSTKGNRTTTQLASLTLIPSCVHYVCAVQESDARSQNYKFTGKERDTESNLDEFGARYYASTMGRFMTPDWAARPTAVPYAVFGDPQSLNLYTFVRNDPVSRADADGHCDWEQETPCDPQGPALTQQKDQQKQAEQTTTQNKSWWQKFTGIFYAKASVSAGLEVGAEV